MDLTERLQRKSFASPGPGSRVSHRAVNVHRGSSVTGRDLVFLVVWIMGLWIWASTLNTVPKSAQLAGLGISLVPASFLFWKRPEYGIVSLMFFASGYLPPSYVDVRLPFGGFEIRDTVLFLMLGLLFIKRLLQKSITIPWWPAGGFLTLFLIMVLLSVFNAIYFEHGTMNWALSEARLLFFYAVFFVVSWGITNRKSLFMLIFGSFVIADITGALVLLQQYAGPDKLLLEAMKDGGWSIYAVGESTRVMPPGIVYLYFMMLISIGLTFGWGENVVQTNILIAHTAFSAVCLLFTFTRSAWAASGIAVAIILSLTLWVHRQHFFRILLISSATLLFIVGVLGSANMWQNMQNSVISSFISRFASIFEPDTSASLSLEWRTFESQQARKSIHQHPLIGVGLGNPYRNLTVLQEEAEGKFAGELGITYDTYTRFTRFAHSSYLNITVKMGIPAIVVLLLFYLASIIQSIFLYRGISDRFAKSLILAIGAGLIGLLEWSVYHAQLMDAASTSVVGLLVGVISSVSRLPREP